MRLRTLLAAGETVVPRYLISQSRAIGRRTVRLGVRPCVVAEGIFAIEFASTLRAQGIPFEALYLDRPRTVVAGLRLRRDLIKHRKPVPVLLRRGFHLWRTQPALRARALAAGFEPVTMRDGLERLS